MKEFDSIIYLLYIDTPEGRLYKIGHTTNSVEKRVVQLQTGCPYEIKIMDKFNSIYGQTIERTLHNMYYSNRMHGEWFKLDNDFETNFISICEKYENINSYLKNKK